MALIEFPSMNSASTAIPYKPHKSFFTTAKIVVRIPPASIGSNGPGSLPKYYEATIRSRVGAFLVRLLRLGRQRGCGGPSQKEKDIRGILASGTAGPIVMGRNHGMSMLGG